MSNKPQIVQPVVLCGGSGTRLWPLSRGGFPKHFLCLTGQTSLFQQATTRLEQLNSTNVAVAAPILVAAEEHRFLIDEQLREVDLALGTTLLEPSGRNTAPALTLAALTAQAAGEDPILVVTPADHTVSDNTSFSLATQRAIDEAETGTIVILGVTPDRPETGYGYIQVDPNSDRAALPVQCFVEKPDAFTAQSYLDSGGYFWNAGIFVLKASVWLNALEKLRPDILQSTRAAWDDRSEDDHFIRPGAEAFKTIPSESIDYAVMEHAAGAGLPIKMVLLDSGWSDLGTWDAVWNALPKDSAGNAVLGDVLSINSHNTLAHASSRLVTLLGVDDLLVIDTPDAVLVADRKRHQEVKQIAKSLIDQNREEHALHRKVHRPWGWYDSIDEGNRFKVKRLHVKPGASLSLQKHRHRSEHWVVVTGTAEIINGDKKLVLKENQSTYIPLGEVHRLTNPGRTPLEIIEVQSGSYLGEDDIVRFEDEYGR